MNLYGRQSFLGRQSLLTNATVCVVGLGGGGSHIVQQLSHLGVGTIIGIDPDKVEDTNLNRLVGATSADALNGTSKVKVATRLVNSVNADVGFVGIERQWQDSLELLKTVDVLIGCVDTYRDRFDLEAFCRRFCIAYVDLGMDVHTVEALPFISGQVICSLPGEPCMRCMGFFKKERLNEEAQDYGAAGPRPQVIWSNGVLASCAVGYAIALLTGWSEHFRHSRYLAYDGNIGTLTTHPRWQEFDTAEPCPHFPLSEMGDSIFIQLTI